MCNKAQVLPIGTGGGEMWGWAVGGKDIYTQKKDSDSQHSVNIPGSNSGDSFRHRKVIVAHSCGLLLEPPTPQPPPTSSNGPNICSSSLASSLGKYQAEPLLVGALCSTPLSVASPSAKAVSLFCPLKVILK